MGMKLHGWDAIEQYMRRENYSQEEIEQARLSFLNGLEVLKRVFLRTAMDDKEDSELEQR